MSGQSLPALIAAKVECLPHHADAQIVQQRRRKRVRVGEHDIAIDLLVLAILADCRIGEDRIAGRLMLGVRVAEEDRVAIGEAMIDAEVRLRPVRLGQGLILEVLALGERVDRRAIRERPEVENLARDRVESVHRDDVAGKQVANLPLAIRIRPRRPRIVDRDQLSLGGAEIAEVALPPFGQRHSRDARRALAQGDTLRDSRNRRSDS